MPDFLFLGAYIHQLQSKSKSTLTTNSAVLELSNKGPKSCSMCAYPFEIKKCEVSGKKCLVTSNLPISMRYQVGLAVWIHCPFVFFQTSTEQVNVHMMSTLAHLS